MQDDLQVDKDLREMLVKKDAPKPKLIGLRIWNKAIPQYNVGHQDLLEVRFPEHALIRHVHLMMLTSSPAACLCQRGDCCLQNFE